MRSMYHLIISFFLPWKIFSYLNFRLIAAEVHVSQSREALDTRSKHGAGLKSRPSCPTLCGPIDGSPPGSCPWESPGKNTGVGCHFLLQCMQGKSDSEVAQLCPILRPHGPQPTRLLCPWDFPGKSTGVGCHCLLRWCRGKYVLRPGVCGVPLRLHLCLLPLSLYCTVKSPGQVTMFVYRDLLQGQIMISILHVAFCAFEVICRRPGDP